MKYYKLDKFQLKLENNSTSEKIRLLMTYSTNWLPKPVSLRKVFYLNKFRCINDDESIKLHSVTNWSKHRIASIALKGSFITEVIQSKRFRKGSFKYLSKG